MAYCEAHKDNIAVKLKNSIYSKVFCQAAEWAGLVNKVQWVEMNRETGTLEQVERYSVIFSSRAYKLTNHNQLYDRMDWFD